MNFTVPRVQAVPVPYDAVSIQVDGQERLKWNGSPRTVRPFFFPVLGPSLRPLTRNGHPSDPTHDHHRSFWVGHRNVHGENYWEENPDNPIGPRIRQLNWLVYQDGDEEAAFAVTLGWFDPQGVRVLRQTLIAVYRPLPGGEAWLEWQTLLTPELEELSLGRVNFGFFGIRVAASLSAKYGGGQLTNSEGGRGEPECFEKSAKWVDYSGPITKDAVEGLTWFDHPGNPNYPAGWHVRDDGWFAPGFNMRTAVTLMQAKPLQLRYGLHVHSGPVRADVADRRMAEFEKSPAWELSSGPTPWKQRVRRAVVD